jgi:Tfp pilus assembly PilM family ATPase
MGRSTSFLGVAVSDRSVTCAEVSIGSGDRRTVRRTATFVFPPDATLDSPDALGQALAAFLRQRKFTASRVVAGVPARWLIAIEKEVPPADEQQARSMLRLQAERLAVAEHGDVVFDFAGRTSSSTISKVLLVGMVRDKLHRVEQMMDAAGTVGSSPITSSGLTLAAAAARRQGGMDSPGGGLLMLGPQRRRSDSGVTTARRACSAMSRT